MTDLPEEPQEVDWSMTTYSGSRLAQLRRWAEMPLEQIIRSLEEMEELAGRPLETPGSHDSWPGPPAQSG